MKKKTLALMGACALTLALTINAGAALISSSSGATAPSVGGAVSSTGVQISSTDLTVTPVVDVSKLPADVAAKLETAYQELNSAGSVASFIEQSGSAVKSAVEKALENTNVSMEHLAVHSLFDVSASGTAADILAADGAVDITFQVPTLRDGDVAIVLHYAHDGWEVVPSTVSDGEVTATFTSLSPVSILVENADAVEDGAVTAPQTSDIAVEGIVLGGAALCVLILAYSVKKAKA